MTDNLKHSTSYYHEAIAHAFEMFKNGYEPVMETPFQPRRLGSAFVTEYKLVRESLNLIEIDNASEMLNNPPEPNAKLREVISINPHAEAAAKLRELAKDTEKVKQLTIQQKWEAEELLNELAAQSQELGMYEKDNGIFDRLVESIESAQNNPEECVSTIVEVDTEQKLVYTREQLDELYWTHLQKVGYKFGVKGRNRNKLTNAILQAQEKNDA